MAIKSEFNIFIGNHTAVTPEILCNCSHEEFLFSAWKNELMKLVINLTAPPEPAESNPCDAFSYPYRDYTQLAWLRYTFILCYLVIILTASGGNLLVMWSVLRHKHMRTVTNCYLFNLAIADFFIAVFVMPLKVLEYSAPCSWHVFATDALCAILYYAQPVVVFSSVLTLVAISIERYHAVAHPFSTVRIHSKCRTRVVIAFTWLISLILASPYLFAKTYTFNIHSELGSISRQICTDRFDDIDKAMYDSADNIGMFRQGYFLFLFFSMYVIPTLVIIFTCARILICLSKAPAKQDTKMALRRLVKKREENRRKVARMIIVIATAFVISWTPFYVVSLVSQLQKDSFLKKSNFLFTMLATHLLGFLNSTVNPLVYNAFSANFRRNFKQILLTVCCCLWKPLIYWPRQTNSFDSKSRRYREPKCAPDIMLCAGEKLTMAHGMGVKINNNAAGSTSSFIMSKKNRKLTSYPEGWRKNETV